MNPILYQALAMLALLAHVGACSVDKPKPVSTQASDTAARPRDPNAASPMTQTHAVSRDSTATNVPVENTGRAMRNSLVVQRDPVTGRLGAPAATVSIPTNPSNYSITGLTPVAQLTGGAVVNLQGRFRGNAIAEIGPDGKVHVDLNYADGAAPTRGKQGSHAQ